MLKSLFASLLLIAGCAPSYHGKIVLINAKNPLPEFTQSVQWGLDSLILCGYTPPPLIFIAIVDLNPDKALHKVTCGEAEIGGFLMYLDENSVRHGYGHSCGRLSNTVAHEALHLIGFRHDTPEHTKAFYQRLVECGFRDD